VRQWNSGETGGLLPTLGYNSEAFVVGKLCDLSPRDVMV
jgi:hypothetical protein